MHKCIYYLKDRVLTGFNTYNLLFHVRVNLNAVSLQHSHSGTLPKPHQKLLQFGMYSQNALLSMSTKFCEVWTLFSQDTQTISHYGPIPSKKNISPYLLNE